MVEIFTDGGCHYNPGAGGYGVVIFKDGEVIHTHSLMCEYTTNNQEEIKAIIYAIGYVIMNKIEDYKIYSDSAYCVNMCHDWIWNWSQNGWQTSKGENIKNERFVKVLYDLLVEADCKDNIIKVKGHANNLGNELADALATDNEKKIKETMEAVKSVKLDK